MDENTLQTIESSGGLELYQEKILKTLLILIWSLALIHMTAEYYYLYWTIRWLDICTHFLGGVWVGVAGVWFWFFSGYMREPQSPEKHILPVALITGLVVGVVWELYEYVVWQLSGAGLPPNYIPDTSLDLVMDITGAFVGFFLVLYILRDLYRFKKAQQEIPN